MKFAERAKKIKVNVQSLEEELKEQESIGHLHSIIRRLKGELEAVDSELRRCKEGEVKQSKMARKKKIFINFPQ